MTLCAFSKAPTPSPHLLSTPHGHRRGSTSLSGRPVPTETLLRRSPVSSKTSLKMVQEVWTQLPTPASSPWPPSCEWACLSKKQFHSREAFCAELFEAGPAARDRGASSWPPAAAGGRWRKRAPELRAQGFPPGPRSSRPQHPVRPPFSIVQCAVWTSSC